MHSITFTNIEKKSNMKRNLFTKNEIILCTYLARFGKEEFNEDEISTIKDRSISSIKMKVQNIAAMLDEEGFDSSEHISKLSGKTTGEKGRRTNWDIVRTLTGNSKQELLNICERILTEV